MAVRVEVAPSLLTWALERSRRDLEELPKSLSRFHEWRTGAVQPTLKQLETYARWTHAPVGQLLLPQPPKEELPVPDFRSGPDADHEHPSADLLDTIYLCQRRQDWFRRRALASGENAVDFVGSVRIRTNPARVAKAIRSRLDFDLNARKEFRSWTEAFRELVSRTEEAGVLVMVSGVVGNNTSRVLNRRDFKGFALSDDYAPVVFINGTDYKAAQIFTLVHELAHVWLGQSAVSDLDLTDRVIDQNLERWCNAVAGEVLVPIESLSEEFDASASVLHDELTRLARLYKVSSLVVLRRLRDAGRLTWDQHDAAFEDEVSRFQEKRQQQDGNFYNTQPARASKRFTRALIADTLEGRTLHRDAYRLLGIRSPSAFMALGEHLGVT